MATKKISGLYAPLGKFSRGNVLSLSATQRTYCTEKEGDNQVTHTGQVSLIHYCI